MGTHLLIPTRYQNDRKVSELKTIRFATESRIEFETAGGFTLKTHEKCKINVKKAKFESSLTEIFYGLTYRFDQYILDVSGACDPLNIKYQIIDQQY